MCFSGGGGGGPQYVSQWGLDNDGNMVAFYTEAGVPVEYAKRGATTTAQYQMMAQQDLSDKQMAAQKEMSDKQLALNQQQFDYQKQLADQQQAQADAQAARQSEYDTGRAGLLAEGTKSVNDAFSQFGDPYFNKYASDYMAKVQDQVALQKREAQKQLAFGVARQGIIDSQATANQQGLLAEQEGRTLADESVNAQNAANTLRANISNAKQNLLGQVQASESIGSPIAASDEGGVQQALQTQRSAISGVNTQAGDVISSINAVPQVSTLGNIFAGLINSGSSYLAGRNVGSGYGAFGRGLGGTRPV